MPDIRWLSQEQAAAYLSVRPDVLPRLVREGRIPAPNYQLGPRSPRWDRLALDSAFDGGTASTDTKKAVSTVVQEILAQGRSRRQAGARRRHG